MKKIIISITLIFALSINFIGKYNALTFEPDFEINSESAYMVNRDNNEVIYEKNKDKKLYPASLTKIMTAIVTIENVPDLENTMVTIPGYIFDEFYRIDVSNADIRRDEIVSMKDLIHALLMQSACEAGSAIADYVGKGSIKNFVNIMNETAKKIGANNTNFVNAHGLHDPNQYSTAYDMYLITNYALSLPKFEEMATAVRYQMASTNKHPQPRYIVHTNLMLDKSRGGKYYYQYAKGIKTGTTDESGRNLVSMASKDGYNYILITMGAPMVYQDGTKISDNLSFVDAKNLYDWAFKTFRFKTILKKDSEVAELKVNLSSGKDFVIAIPSQDITCLLPSSISESAIMLVPNLPKQINAPIKSGQKLGTLELKLADNILVNVDLIAKENIERSNFAYIMQNVKNILNSTWFKAIAIVLLILIIIFLILRFSNNQKKKKLRKIKNRRKI